MIGLYILVLGWKKFFEMHYMLVVGNSVYKVILVIIGAFTLKFHFKGIRRRHKVISTRP